MNANDNIPPGGTPPTPSATLPATGLVRLSRVLELIPISRSSFYAGQAKGLYPRPVAIGPRARAYRVEDIRTLIEKGVA
ncbi:helix-turn-helix transcriptional regulator [Methylobacterium aquaticum]|uniref:Regulatory protein n=1 Tax=Methylobacterium aquaticum TaxID=270351 RepID=A0A0C6FUF8_9HYPH|nr:AlpA family phage regulatory protein [Methylobacterium aquaticum]BAQ46715.1 regulatory protein [Methylobacterium aquaticum]